MFDTTYLERSCPAKDEKIDSSNLPMREAEQFFVKEISFTRPAFSSLVFSSVPGTACNFLSRRIKNRWNARLLKLMIKMQDFLAESKVQRVDLKRKLEKPTKVKRFTNQSECSRFENVKLSTVQKTITC